MRRTALLLTPPPSLPLAPPAGSLPALAAALRTAGYQVIQRDLGVEALPLLFDISVAGRLFERGHALLSAVNRNGASETDTIRKTARAIRDQGLPHLERLKTAYDRRREGMEHTTYKRIQDYYLGFFRFLSYVSRSPLEWFTEGPDREVDALHALLFADLLADIDWSEIVLVGLSVHHHNVEMSLAIARTVRTHYPQVHIVLGGDWFTSIDFENKYDLEDITTLLGKHCDSIVYREGDAAIVRIMDCLTKDASWDEVPNLIRSRQGRVSLQRPECTDNVGDLPICDFDGLPVDQYPGLPVEVSRGCYWARCSFCRWYQITKFKEMYPRGQPIYRFFPPERLVSSLRRYQTKYGKNTVDFTCLDVSPSQMVELCDAIIEAGLKVRWGARLRLDKTLVPAMFEKMKDAGAYYFHIHPETLTQRTADLHDKGYNVDHVLRLTRYWEDNSHRLPPLFLNVFTAFPGETLEDFKETFENLKAGSFYMQYVHFWWLAKNSGIYHNPQKYGIRLTKQRTPKPLENFVWEADDKVSAEMSRIKRFLQENSDAVMDRCVPLPHYNVPRNNDAPGAARE